MDFKNRHPLNAIEGYENLSMLEALIPFVDYSLKLPLALFLKYSETKLIIKCFQSTENLIRLGLHNPYNDPLDMICSFTGVSKEMLSMLFSMMEGGDGAIFSNLFNTTSNSNSDTGNTTFGFSPEDITKAMNLFQAMQANTTSSDTTQAYTTPSDMSQSYTAQSDTTQAYSTQSHTSQSQNYNNSDDFEQNIQRLLAEYDLEQAQVFDTSTQRNTNDYYNNDDESSSQHPY